MFWSIFVLGHDCGHGSFSRWQWLNDIIGNFLHSLILVPYQMWRLSHRHHHKNTGNYEKDEIFFPEFYPDEKKQPPLFRRVFKENYFLLGVGFAFYLLFGYSNRNGSHFNPWAPLFKGYFLEVFVSLIGWFGAFCCLVHLSTLFGLTKILMFYGVPWFVFSSWLVVTTFLHHNEPEVPWYSDTNWNYVKGNLSSVDRDYGIFQSLTHNIGTHQVHHLFPKIPHYYLEEATKNFRDAFPEHVRISKRSIIGAFVANCKVFAQQHTTFGNYDVFTYKK